MQVIGFDLCFSVFVSFSKHVLLTAGLQPSGQNEMRKQRQSGEGEVTELATGKIRENETPYLQVIEAFI